MLRSLSGPALTHAMIHLASKMLMNCEAQARSPLPPRSDVDEFPTPPPVENPPPPTSSRSLAPPARTPQVALQPQNAFPLAEVAMRVAMQVPRFLQLLTALLHEACPMAVPKTYAYVPSAYKSEEDFYLKMGYRKADGALESGDAFVTRMGGYVLFFAALLQVDGAPPEALERLWAWLARALNRLPPDRLVASSILNVLKMAGFRLHREYGRQFFKLLLFVNEDFLGRLEAAGDPDARAAHTRIRTFLQDREFQNEPEGRRMPVAGVSDELRA